MSAPDSGALADGGGSTAKERKRARNRRRAATKRTPADLLLAQRLAALAEASWGFRIGPRGPHFYIQLTPPLGKPGAAHLEAATVAEVVAAAYEHAATWGDGPKAVGT